MPSHKNPLIRITLLINNSTSSQAIPTGYRKNNGTCRKENWAPKYNCSFIPPGESLPRKEISKINIVKTTKPFDSPCALPRRPSEFVHSIRGPIVCKWLLIQYGNYSLAAFIDILISSSARIEAFSRRPRYS